MAGHDAFSTVLERMTEGGDFEEIANVHNLSGPGLEREEYDVTTHSSPGQWEEIIFGIKRTGEVECEVYFDSEQHLHVIREDFAGSEPNDYRMSFPDGGSWEFSAGLTGCEFEFPHDGPMEASMTFKLSGPPSFMDEETS
ncbi:phage tail tube protein [Nocardiopsis salina]|uniref:phage tail tube protein n=1 Tax=Nocardiopsis salina TaxID=245836 RepID=UPI00034673FB|nr:phage tail tube protein [Nocardiopsis salina]